MSPTSTRAPPVSPPPSFPVLQLPLFGFIFALATVLCSARPSPYRKLLFLPHLSACLFFILHVRGESLVYNYALNTTICINLFMMFDFLVLTDIQNTFRLRGEKTQIWREGLSKRLVWSSKLVYTIRGVGWEHEPVAHIPKAKHVPRTKFAFLVHHLLIMARCLVTYLVSDTIMQLDPAFLQHGPSFSDPGRPVILRPLALVHGLATMAAMEATYSEVGIASVMLGLSKPDEWPPIFGSLLDAWSVWNFWRKFWHQGMRRMFSSISDSLAETLGIRARTLRLVVKLYASFFISGIIHYCADASIIFSHQRSTSIKFFLLQATAITFELLVARLGQSIEARLPFRLPWSAKRILGYIWVGGWLSVTYGMWIEPVLRAGMSVDNGWHSPLVLKAAEMVRQGVLERA